MEVSKDRAHRAWRSAERIKRLSDRLVGVGPIGVGLDGVLAWVPVAGTVYSLGAGALLISEGIAVGASAPTLMRMAAYIALDSASSVPPVIGWLVDTLFPGHLMAANALQKDIEARHGPSELTDDWLRRPRARKGVLLPKR
ncbi:DUF4112 domain-containing protein [Phenylobacterium sp.]|uniref:DUF4112 domain-containing protein n=1 Tax=Phenylobacterium sp. TaxID=1871053 RepID=UPI002736966A|nr:DUF4112 domain-containing protein [Phenylobacterium sp.]MDP3854357.1 DUF4112 domain-containing protein [Phenylobacterium sp.]